MEGNGGAAYIVWDIDLIIADTSFLSNQAVLKGMAMFLARLSASSRVEFTNVTFDNNAYHCPLGQYSFDVIDEVSMLNILFADVRSKSTCTSDTH